MRKIVKGVLFDTDTSKLLYTDVEKDRFLYKAKNGTYFMLYSNGEIVVKTKESTMDYLGERDIDAYIAEFGEPQEA